MSDPSPAPIGVVLAGGRGRRLGGDKALAMLGSRPLISYPLAAMSAVLADVAVVAKPGTALPPPARLCGAEVWLEPAEPRHPLVGLLYALRRAAGRPVLVCASDLPFVTPAVLRALTRAPAGGAPAVLACSASGAAQPLLGRYEPAAADLLAGAARAAAAPLQAAVAAIGPRHLTVEDPDALFNVNSPQDLAAAEALLAVRRRRHD
ncbi:MAG: NTP transferase domain-containing protein [Solirubrobacteraceae bacterium]|jgi:molybdopterin-guanine dinucleotide biosynthesis protein A